jgi:hypothetical protein
MVDALQNIPYLRSGLVEQGAVGVVDVAATVRLGVQKLAADLELPRDSPEVMFQVHDHGRS